MVYASAVDVMLTTMPTLLKALCNFALFKALFLGVSPELEDYFEATLRLGREEANCFPVKCVWLSEAAGSHNDFQRASSEGPACWVEDISD